MVVVYYAIVGVCEGDAIFGRDDFTIGFSKGDLVDRWIQYNSSHSLGRRV